MRARPGGCRLAGRGPLPLPGYAGPGNWGNRGHPPDLPRLRAAPVPRGQDAAKRDSSQVRLRARVWEGALRSGARGSAGHGTGLGAARCCSVARLLALGSRRGLSGRFWNGGSGGSVWTRVRAASRCSVRPAGARRAALAWQPAEGDVGGAAGPAARGTVCRDVWSGLVGGPHLVSEGCHGDGASGIGCGAFQSGAERIPARLSARASRLGHRTLACLSPSGSGLCGPRACMAAGMFSITFSFRGGWSFRTSIPALRM